MHNQTHGLIDHNDRIVFVDDVEVHFHGAKGEFFRTRLSHDFDFVTGAHLLANLRDDGTVHLHGFIFDPQLQSSAGHTRHQLSQDFVQTFAHGVVRCNKVIGIIFDNCDFLVIIHQIYPLVFRKTFLWP